MKKIFVLGSTNTDMVIADRKLPAPGETISGGKFMLNPGGKGASQAVAVARLAAKRGECVFVAKVGDDLFGRDAAARFRAEGIDARLVVDRKNPSGTALILVDAKGQNVISVALGANGTLSPADVKPRLKDLKGAAALLMQLETPIPTVLAAAKAAKAAGVMVVLNPAPAAKLPKELYPLIDWITPNETEAELLTGVKVKDAKSAQLAVDALKRKGVKNVAITMGAKGVYCGNCRRLYPAKKVKAVDCVAAGDTFNGVLAACLSRGRTLEEATVEANSAAARSVTRPYVLPAIPRA